MEISIGENRVLTLAAVYEVIGIKTDVGTFYLCQRDGGLEMQLDNGLLYDWKDNSGPSIVGAVSG